MSSRKMLAPGIPSPLVSVTFPEILVWAKPGERIVVMRIVKSSFIEGAFRRLHGKDSTPGWGIKRGLTELSAFADELLGEDDG